MVKRLRVMEKKLTNSGPFRESVDKHSIYTMDIVDDVRQISIRICDCLTDVE